MALHLRAEHIHSLHLLVLLLSAQKQHNEALQLIEAALEEYPDNLKLVIFLLLIIMFLDNDIHLFFLSCNCSARHLFLINS